jgi:hypothetical protein
MADTSVCVVFRISYGGVWSRFLIGLARKICEHEDCMARACLSIYTYYNERDVSCVHPVKLIDLRDTAAAQLLTLEK